MKYQIFTFILLSSLIIGCAKLEPNKHPEKAIVGKWKPTMWGAGEDLHERTDDGSYDEYKKNGTIESYDGTFDEYYYGNYEINDTELIILSKYTNDTIITSSSFYYEFDGSNKLTLNAVHLLSTPTTVFEKIK